jgi:hypothetical protein
MSISSICSLPFRFPDQHFVCILIPPIRYILHSSLLPDSVTLIVD